MVNEPTEEVDQEESIEVQSPKRNNPFTEEDLQHHIKEFAAAFEKRGAHHEALLLKEKFDFEDNTIKIKISNEALESTFERMRSNLLTQLRNKLENDHLQLRSEIVELEKQQMLYTDKEKFEHLKKKYPALKDFQEKFGLDPEF